MSRKKRYAQVEMTAEAQITAPDLDPEVTTTPALGQRRRGIGLRCSCGTQMRVERTRRPGHTYPNWLRTPYRVWCCPKCRKKVRQNINENIEGRGPMP
jgi:hypothetical protein